MDTQNCSRSFNINKCVKYLLRRGQRTIIVDNDSFWSVEAYHAEAQLYKIRGKEVANEEDVPVRVPIRHLLARFTGLVT